MRAMTTPQLQAIPTNYNGIEFRSRLEANVARCFDACGVTWAYEQEGIDLGGVWYLPDFWLPAARQFVEAKGQADDPSVEKPIRLAHALYLRDGDGDDEAEAARPARVVLLAPPFIRHSRGVANEVFGSGFNGVEQVDSLLCLCWKCGAKFFATVDGKHDCSACGAYQHDGSYGDLCAVEVLAEHRRGETRYSPVEIRP